MKKQLTVLVALMSAIFLVCAGSPLGWARDVPRDNLAPHTPMGEWRGHYLCQQGIMGLTLTVREEVPGLDREMVALFDFYPLEENPTQSGQFTLKGSWDKAQETIEFLPDRWIDQPPGWAMVGLKLKPSDDFSYMTGIVTRDICGSVFLERAGTGYY